MLWEAFLAVLQGPYWWLLLILVILLGVLGVGIYLLLLEMDPEQPGPHANLYKIFDLKKNGQVQLQLNGSYWLVDNRGAMQPGIWEIGDQCGPERSFYGTKSGYVRAIRP